MKKNGCLLRFLAGTAGCVIFYNDCSQLFKYVEFRHIIEKYSLQVKSGARTEFYEVIFEDGGLYSLIDITDPDIPKPIPFTSISAQRSIGREVSIDVVRNNWASGKEILIEGISKKIIKFKPI